MQTVKRLLRKALQDNADPYLALLNFKTTPALDGGPSPAHKLMNRNPRTLLLSVNRPIPTTNVPTNKYPSQYYNTRVKNLPRLKRNDTVRIHNGRSWATKGRIVDQESNTPRSYIVETENGNMLRKNRRDIMYTNETVEPSPDYDQLELCAPVPTTDNRGRANNARPR